MFRTSTFHIPATNSLLNPSISSQVELRRNRPNPSFKLVSPGDQVKLSVSHSKHIHFEGAAASQKLREGYLVSEDAPSSVKMSRPWPADCVKDIIKADDTPHVGNIPKPLLEKSQLSEPAFFTGIDQLAFRLNRGNCWQKLLSSIFPNKHELGALKLSVKKIGEGFYNKAYQLSDGENAYVLKIRKNKPLARLLFLSHQSFNNSVYHDIGLGLFLAHHQIYKDVARHYAANPANPKAGWLLGEYIPKNTKVSTREGKALYIDIPARVADDRPGNRVGYKSKSKGEPGVLCDLGDPWDIAVPHPLKPE